MKLGNVFSIDGAGARGQSRMHMEGLAGAKRRKRCPPGQKKVGIRCTASTGGKRSMGHGVYKDRNGRCHNSKGKFVKCRGR